MALIVGGSLVLLALLSALLLVFVPRWQPLPGKFAVLADPTFATVTPPGTSPVWRLKGGDRIAVIDAGIRLTNDDPHATVAVDQVIDIPPGAAAFHVSADVTLTNAAGGPESWHRARISLEGLASDGQPRWSGPIQLLVHDGSLGPRRLGTVVPSSSPIDKARLTIRLERTTGVLEVRDLQVEPMVRPPARDILRHVLITGWMTIGAGIGLLLWWQSRNRVAATLVLGGLGLMALAAVLPYGVRQPLHQLLYDMAGGEQQLAMLKPVLHLVAFAVLAMASRLAQPQRPLPLFVTCWLAAAVLLELAELLVGLFDSDDVIDMVFNAAGAMIGLAVAGRVLQRRRDQEEAPDPATDRLVSRRP